MTKKNVYFISWALILWIRVLIQFIPTGTGITLNHSGTNKALTWVCFYSLIYYKLLKLRNSYFEHFEACV